MTVDMILDLYQGTDVLAPIALGLRASCNAGDCCDVDGDCSNCD